MFVRPLNLAFVFVVVSQVAMASECASKIDIKSGSFALDLLACLQSLEKENNELKSAQASISAKSPSGAEVPIGAVMAFDLSDECPAGWSRFDEAMGRFVLGSGAGQGLTQRDFRSRDGKERYQLTEANLPPHRHQVYPHAGEIIGHGGIVEAGAKDGPITDTSRVRDSQTGNGFGQSEPYNVMPPFISLRFCKKKA